jgi:hypothetical protein
VPDLGDRMPGILLQKSKNLAVNGIHAAWLLAGPGWPFSQSGRLEIFNAYFWRVLGLFCF